MKSFFGIKKSKFFSSPLVWVFSVILFCKALWLFLSLTIFKNTGWHGHLLVDLWGWLDFLRKSQDGLIPYVDFSKEYPVGAGILYWFMSHFINLNNIDGYVFVHGIFMFLCDLLNTVLFFKIAEKINKSLAPYATLLFSLNFTAMVLSPVRFESYVTLLVLLGLHCHLEKKYNWATFWWAIGCSMKWFPIFFVFIQEWNLIHQQSKNWIAGLKKHPWWKSIGIFTLVTALIHLPFIVISLFKYGNINSWWYSYAFHIHRPLYWDTLLGVGQMWFGNWDFEIYASYWTLIFILLVLFPNPRMKLLFKAVLVCIAAIVFNRVYSTQFHLWFYPFLILIWLELKKAEAKSLLLVFLILDFLNIYIYPFSFTGAYSEMKNFGILSAHNAGGIWTFLFSLAIVVRTVVLVFLGEKLWHYGKLKK